MRPSDSPTFPVLYIQGRSCLVYKDYESLFVPCSGLDTMWIISAFSSQPLCLRGFGRSANSGAYVVALVTQSIMEVFE